MFDSWLGTGVLWVVSKGCACDGDRGAVYACVGGCEAVCTCVCGCEAVCVGVR